MPGSVSKIYLRPSARTPLSERFSAKAVAGRGLEGDHAGGGSRQITVLSEEGWSAACRQLRRDDLEPQARRANIVVRGVDLRQAIGGGLRIGDCLLRIVGETRPCRLMDDAAPGLQAALDPDMRGGVYGQVLVGGDIHVGDAVVVTAAASDESEEPQRPRPSAKGASSE